MHETPMQSFCANINARRGVELRRALVNFTHLVTPLCCLQLPVVPKGFHLQFIQEHLRGKAFHKLTCLTGDVLLLYHSNSVSSLEQPILPQMWLIL